MTNELSTLIIPVTNVFSRVSGARRSFETKEDEGGSKEDPEEEEGLDEVEIDTGDFEEEEQ